MRRYVFISILMTGVFYGGLAPAQIEPGYSPTQPPGTTIWYAPADDAARKADLDFVTGMHPHHAGALTMSREYLSDKNASHPQLKRLAQAIIDNQAFEITLLDKIRDLQRRPDDDRPSFLNLRPVAVKGLGQQKRFVRRPVPGRVDRTSQASVRDVQFAKAMIIHHQGALDMARDYLKDGNARNGYLRLMCLDIIKDQTQEIAWMEKLIATYDGDASKIKIDPSMVHGMDHMNHGSTTDRHQKKTKSAPATAQTHHGHH